MPDSKNVGIYSFPDIYYAVRDEKTGSCGELRPLNGVLGVSFGEIRSENVPSGDHGR